MKFLLDMPVSPVLIGLLECLGHDGVHVSQIGRHNATDLEILEIARVERRVVITADLDFPRLLFLSRAGRTGLILFRGGNYSESEMRSLLERVLREVPEERISCSVSVVSKKRIRVTPLR